MTPGLPNERALVVYIRDAKASANVNLLDRGRMQFKDAIKLAIANHQPGESPVIIGTGIQLVGIEAILAASNSEVKSI
jgi:hypothetical protein